MNAVTRFYRRFVKDLEDFDIEERSTVALECQTSQEVKVTWKRGKKVIKESERYEVSFSLGCITTA